MNRAEVGVGPRFGKRISEALIRIHHLRFEALVFSNHVMRNVVAVGPANGCAGGHRYRVGRKNEVIDLDLSCRLVLHCYCTKALCPARYHDQYDGESSKAQSKSCPSHGLLLILVLSVPGVTPELNR